MNLVSLLFTQNAQLTQLRPSSSCNPPAQNDSIVTKLLNYAASTFEKKTNWASVAAAFDRESHWQKLSLELIPLHLLIGYLQNSVESDQGASEEFKSSYEQLRQQFQKWDEISQAFDHVTQETQKILYLKQLAEEVIQLKSGQKKLIVANTQPNDQIFYLFSKGVQGVSFRVIGRGKSMQKLLESDPKKENLRKVRTSISFCSIPENEIFTSERLQELLKCAGLNKSFDANALRVQLDNFRKYQAEEQSEKVAKKLKHCFKSIWSALKQVDPKSKTLNKRTLLRVQLASLFRMYQECRDTLKTDTEEFRTLEAFHRVVSQEAYTVYQKECISLDELEEIVSELTVIKKALENAPKIEIPLLDQMKDWSMHRYTDCFLKDLGLQIPCITKRAELVVKELRPSVSVPIVQKPAVNAAFPKMVLKHNEQFQDADVLKLHIEHLLSLSSRNEVIEAVYRLDFMPYIQKDTGSDFTLDESCVWTKLSQAESIEIMEKLNKLSEWLVNRLEVEMEEPLDTFEVLLKLSTIVLFFNARWFQIPDRYSFNHCSRIDPNAHLSVYLNYKYENNRNQSWWSRRSLSRVGIRLSSLNTRLIQESKLLFQLIKWEKNPSLSESEACENTKYYRKQLDLMDRLDTLQEYSLFFPSIMEKWMRPLVHPFLFAAYFKMTMQISESDKIDNFEIVGKICEKYFNRIRGFSVSGQHLEVYGASDTETRIMQEDCTTQIRRKDGMKTQEAIVDDPLTVANFLIDEVNNLISDRIRFRSLKFPPLQEPLLSKPAINFSEREVSAILSLLRKAEPQTELIAFMENEVSLMERSEVRNFVDMLFFDVPLRETLVQRIVFKNALPQTLDRKIQEFRKKSASDYSYIDQLVFFIEFSAKLRAIYEAQGYATDAFNRDSRSILRSFLGNSSNDTALHPYLHGLLSAELFLIFSQSELSSEDISLLLIDYSLSKNTTGNPLNQDPALKHFIKKNFDGLIFHLKQAKLEISTYKPVLDYIFSWKKLAPDMSWTGEFPLFQKGEYQIDLEKGLIKKVAVNEITGGSFPDEVVLDPFFKTVYGIAEPGSIDLTLLETQEGAMAFLFKDSQSFPCRIEGKKGSFRYYKTFPFHSGELQAIPLNHIQPKIDNDTSFSMKKLFAFLRNGLNPPSIPSLPLLFDQCLYMDPKNPLNGFCIGLKDNLLFKIEFEEIQGYGLKIKSIFDHRDNSGPWEVICGADISHPVIDKLSCIEHPSQMLLYAQNKTFTRMELPRFGMQFGVKENTLTCLDPAFKGYSIDLSASEKDKKEIAFAILLTHKDRDMPKKLLIPGSAAFDMNIHRQLKMDSGIAWFMWFVQMSKQPPIESKIHYEITSKEEKIPYHILDIRPCTGELLCPKDKRVQAFLEVATQMIIFGKFEVAFQTIVSLKLKKSELSNKHKKLIATFLNKMNTYTTAEAAIKLKFIIKLRRLVREDAQHDQFKQGLDSLILQLAPLYFNPEGKLSDLLKLTKVELEYVVKLIKAKNPEIIPLLTESSIQTKIKQKPQEEWVDTELYSIAELEAAIKPDIPVELKELERPFVYVKNGPPLLFHEHELDEFYTKEPIKFSDIKLPDAAQNRSTCEKEALKNLKGHLKDFQNTPQYRYKLTESPKKLKKLLSDFLASKLDHLGRKTLEAASKLDRLITHSQKSEEQAAIYGKLKVMAPYPELMLALLQNNLGALKEEGCLPVDLDCEVLQEALIDYFDLEVKLNLAETAYAKLDFMADLHGFLENETWETDSTQLYHLLTYNRRYDPKQNPELLIFEALKFITFRQLGGQSHQLELLINILKSPTGVAMAATGSGKTMIILVLRGLMKANGKNLVTKKVLPMLYKQTLDVLKKDLGDTFKKTVYPLRFDLNMPLIKAEKVYKPQKDSSTKIEIEHVSVFKQMYKNMLKAIIERGCILTDYKSFPLLEEKFWKLNLELLALREENEPFDKIELEHWYYLKKILILLKNREDEIMDEFDQPNRPIHRIQLQLEKAKKAAPFLAEESLKIYIHLLNQKQLLLKENLQRDVSQKVREECLKRVADELAKKMTTKNVSQQELSQYILGKSEAVLDKINDWTPAAKDTLAFYKDQFCTYLPMTLSCRGKSKYARSDDGKRILPCLSGEKHDAKFGSITEEINYTIQDYLQRGVKEIEIKEWLDNLLNEQKLGHQSAEERFRQIFPKHTLHKKLDAAQLTTEINNDTIKVIHFLQLRLNTLAVSGKVISMDPQNIISMSKAVSGISATLGCAEVLHSQFSVNKNAAWKIRSEMLYRLIQRLDGQVKLLKYNPYEPMKFFAKSKENYDYCALIDGAGAYIEFESEKVAKQMAQANPKLQRIGFHKDDGSEDFIGSPHATIGFRGYYFSESNTRGADKTLKDEAIALLTVDSQGSLESLSQHEGRMRLPGQKVVLASSELATDLQTPQDVILTKVFSESTVQSNDLYKGKIQELENIKRADIRALLLNILNLNAFLDEFKKHQSLFITPAADDYQQPGFYFAKNKHIRRRDCNPKTVLETRREELIQECLSRGLTQTAEKYKKIQYPPELIKMMPEKVFGIQKHMEETELEVELEVECEVEMELELENEEELEFELEKEKQLGATDIPYHLLRLETDIIHSVKDKIHSAYDYELMFTESFLPLTRKDPLFRRKAFDPKMYRIGPLHVEIELKIVLEKCKIITVPGIKQVTIGDLFDDTLPIKAYDFIYDIRTGAITKFESLSMEEWKENNVNKFIATDEFRRIIAQIKFLDGQTEGYTPQEAAQLRKWLIENDPRQMKNHFEKEVLKNRADVIEKYPFSQLWKLFKSLEEVLQR